MRAIASHEESFARLAAELGLVSESIVASLERKPGIPLARQLVIAGLLDMAGSRRVFEALRHELDRDAPARHRMNAEETLAHLAVRERICRPEALEAALELARANATGQDSVLSRLFGGALPATEVLAKLRALRDAEYLACPLCGEDVEKSAIGLRIRNISTAKIVKTGGPGRDCPACGYPLDPDDPRALEERSAIAVAELSRPLPALDLSGMTGASPGSATTGPAPPAPPNQAESSNPFDSTPTDDHLNGRVLGGKIELARRIGAGGMGAVYLGRHITLGIDVAVKIMPQQLALRSEFLKRFELEARSAARLQHPNIVRVIDLDRDRELVYLVMEFVDGCSAGEKLRKDGPFSVPLALRIATDAAMGLGAAHEAGIIHRDIKPDNVMLARTGEAKVADFGLARLIEGTHLSQTGAVMGSPAFMAPEQVRGEPATVKSDIYSLGVTIFTLLVGSSPFQRDNPLASMMASVDQPLPDLARLRPEAPPELGVLVAHMAAKEAMDRPQSMQEIVTRLTAICDLAPIDSPAARRARAAIRSTARLPTATPSRPWLKIIAAAVVLTLGAAAGAWVYRTELEAILHPVGEGSHIADPGLPVGTGQGSPVAGSATGSPAGSTGPTPSRPFADWRAQVEGALADGSAPPRRAWDALALPAVETRATWTSNELAQAEAFLASSRATLVADATRRLGDLERGFGADLPAADHARARRAALDLAPDTEPLAAPLARCLAASHAHVLASTRPDRDPRDLVALGRELDEIGATRACLSRAIDRAAPPWRDLEQLRLADAAWRRHLGARVDGEALLVRRRAGDPWRVKITRADGVLHFAVVEPIKRAATLDELDPALDQVANTVGYDGSIQPARRELAAGAFLVLTGGPAEAAAGWLMLARARFLRDKDGAGAQLAAMYLARLEGRNRAPVVAPPELTPAWWADRASARRIDERATFDRAEARAEWAFAPAAGAGKGSRHARHAGGALEVAGGELVLQLPAFRPDRLAARLSIRGAGAVRVALGGVRWDIEPAGASGRRRSSALTRWDGDELATRTRREAWWPDATAQTPLAIEIVEGAQGSMLRCTATLGTTEMVVHEVDLGTLVEDARERRPGWSLAGVPGRPVAFGASGDATVAIADVGFAGTLDKLPPPDAPEHARLLSLDRAMRELDPATPFGAADQPLFRTASQPLFTRGVEALFEEAWRLEPEQAERQWQYRRFLLAGAGRGQMLIPRPLEARSGALFGMRYQAGDGFSEETAAPAHALVVRHAPTARTHRFRLPYARNAEHRLVAWILPAGPLACANGIALSAEPTAEGPGPERLLGIALDGEASAPLLIVEAAWQAR